jgi:hypothetical protein
MAADLRFDQFTSGGNCQVGDQVVGLRSSDLTQNFIFDFPGIGVKDVNGNLMLQWATTGILAVNWPKVINSLPGLAVEYTAEGDDTDIPIWIRPKGAAGLKLDELNWPLSDGVAGSGIITDGFGNLSFGGAPVVSSATGTVHQVLVNGTSGVPQTGALVFTTPQDIDVTSSPTFNALTLTTPLSLTSGGSNASLTASNGGMVYSDATKMQILAGTATARQMLQSGASSAPAWSTATWPATTTINQILYSSSANTVVGLSTANSAVLTTTSAGVPVFSTSMTNGQLIIGSTGATPTASTLTAGTGISISNTAGAITISGTGGGMSWTEVTGASQSMSPDNGYIANNAGLVTLTLPVTAAIGTAISVIGKGAGGWLIAQNVNQSIRFGSSTTTVGVGGSLASTQSADSINLICTTANTVWTVLGGVQGVITTV